MRKLLVVRPACPTGILARQKLGETRQDNTLGTNWQRLSRQPHTHLRLGRQPHTHLRLGRQPHTHLRLGRQTCGNRRSKHVESVQKVSCACEAVCKSPATKSPTPPECEACSGVSVSCDERERQRDQLRAIQWKNTSENNWQRPGRQPHTSKRCRGKECFGARGTPSDKYFCAASRRRDCPLRAIFGRATEGRRGRRPRRHWPRSAQRQPPAAVHG